MTAKTAARVPLLNRELGILAFNRRVLAQAADEAVPLLERLRFLTIVSSNLDEFFEIRVAGIKEQIKLGITDPGPDGLTPKETLAIVTREARALVTQQFDLLNDALLPQLAANGIRFLRRGTWNDAQRAWVHDYFKREVLPVLTPIGLDPAHPFPRVFNKSLNLIVELEGRDAFGRGSRVAIVQAPRILPRAIRLPAAIAEGEYSFVYLTSVLHAHVDELFAGMTREGRLPVPRDAQLRPVRRRGGNQEPADRAAGRADAAALRRRGAPRGGRGDLARDDRLPAAAVPARRAGPVSHGRAGEPRTACAKC